MPRHIYPLCRSRKLASLIVSLFLTAVLNLLGGSTAERAAPIDGNYRVVERVIDGDTLLMDNGERVRLIGVDTPETKHPRKPVEHFGKEAAAFTRRTVEGKRVRLEFDPAKCTTSHKETTQQRRTLACVFLEDGSLVNAEIIRQGYGFAIHAFRSHGCRSLDAWKVRRESSGEGSGPHINAVHS